jgi:hypothetical protein
LRSHILVRRVETAVNISVGHWGIRSPPEVKVVDPVVDAFRTSEDNVDLVIEDGDVSKDRSPTILQKSYEARTSIVLAKSTGPVFEESGVTVGRIRVVQGRERI